MNQNSLMVGVEETIDSEATTQLKSALSVFGDDAEIQILPDQGPQAQSILLLGISSVALIFTGAFFAKLGHKAAEDAYPHIKTGLSLVYKKYFGKDPEYKMSVVASGNAKLKASETKYSLVLSLYCVGVDNRRVKFIYEKDWSESQFNAATEQYLEAMAVYTATNAGDVGALIGQSVRNENHYLVAWDSETKELVLIDWRST